MKFISHRGNIFGQNKKENEPSYVCEALVAGYECEIDVWVIDKKVHLGHDYPKYEIKKDFVKQNGLWLHAKNIDALKFLLEIGVNCFWHHNDDFTLTSAGYIWAYPTVNYSNGVIAVLPEKYNGGNLFNCVGVCSDYILEYKTIIFNSLKTP